MDVEMTDEPLASTVGPDQPQTVNPSMLLNGQAPNSGASSESESSSIAEANGTSMNDVHVIDMTNTDSEEEEETSMVSEKPTDKSSKNEEETSMALEKATDEASKNEVIRKLSSKSRAEALFALSRRTGVCYDPRMRAHYNMASDDVHPEDPGRIRDIFNTLVGAGLLADPNSISPHPDDLLVRILARPASSDEICSVHTESHFNFIRALEDETPEQLLALSEKSDSVFYNAHTFAAARIAAGGAIESCKAVLSGEVKNAIALIRPPGHHAVHDEAQGFCIFNNVSIAVKFAQKAFRDKCRKILIFDWDVHHGNGTQETFYSDPNVLYMSIHVYANGDFYPGDAAADHLHCGEGLGVGKTVNVPWTEKGMGNAEYMYAFQKVIMPIAWEFNPDLVIISAGFDAAEGDAIGGCYVTPGCYAQMTHALMGLANGKVVACLEGGYNIPSLSRCALAVTKTLAGETPDRVELNPISRRAMHDVHKVLRRQTPYWRCMGRYKADYDLSRFKGKHLHDIIREHQVKTFHDEFNMATLPVFHQYISESLEDQVLATRHWSKKDILLVIVHDPPELEGASDEGTNRLKAHDIRVIDPLKDYIRRAISKGWGVIDVNIPMFLSGTDEQRQLERHLDWREQLSKQALVYLWDNYIQLSKSQNVIFLGVGDPYRGILHLLNSRNCFSSIEGVVYFIDEADVGAIDHRNDPDILIWYRQNTLIFLNDKYNTWDKGQQPNWRKKFGRVKKSPKNNLTAMVEHHRAEVMSWLAQQLQDD